MSCHQTSYWLRTNNCPSKIRPLHVKVHFLLRFVILLKWPTWTPIVRVLANFHFAFSSSQLLQHAFLSVLIHLFSLQPDTDLLSCPTPFWCLSAYLPWSGQGVLDVVISVAAADVYLIPQIDWTKRQVHLEQRTRHTLIECMSCGVFVMSFVFQNGNKVHFKPKTNFWTKKNR